MQKELSLLVNTWNNNICFAILDLQKNKETFPLLYNRAFNDLDQTGVITLYLKKLLVGN